MTEMAGRVAHKEQSRNTYRVLVGRPEGQRLLGRPRRIWEYILMVNGNLNMFQLIKIYGN